MKRNVPSQSTTVRSHAVVWSLALVLSCGLLLGYYVLQTYLAPKHRQYQLDFGDAQWIEPAEAGPTAYFRTAVFLTGMPEQAWLEVSATDNFKAIINSRTIGVEDSVKTRVAGIYDIKKRLKTGTNVIAISISRTSFPGAAQLLVRGFIRERGGKTTELVSDGSWKVTTETGIVRGSEEWTSSKVQDEQWPRAIRSKIADNSVPIAWVDLNPLILQSTPSGSWITSENAASEVTFSTVLKANHARQETWLQIAASGDLDLVINGHLITAAEGSSAGARLPHLPTKEAASSAQKAGKQAEEKTSPKETEAIVEKAILDVYDISYWIKSGDNSIVATVRADHRPATLLVSGFFVTGDGRLQKFDSNSQWLAKDLLMQREAQPKQAVELGENGSAPWGYLPQEFAKPVSRAGFVSMLRDWLTVTLTAAAVLGIWLLLSGLVASGRDEVFRRVMVRDALFHVPITIGLLFLLLPNYDLRFPAGWAFQNGFVVAAVLLLLGMRLFHLFPIDEFADQLKPRVPRFDRAILPFLVLFGIMAFGLALRFHNLGYMSFDHDEMGLVNKSKGIYTLGFPYTINVGEVRWITTYEAVPYPLALSGLFGYSEWTMRLPSCLMGTLSIGLIALLGRRLFNWRTGLCAAFVYACLPLNIRWAQNCFYPQQCQFMALLTTWLFYEAIRLRPLRSGYLIGAAIAFCLTYLSWEGSAFLLPSLFVGLMVYRWGEWWWLKEWSLYRAIFVVGAVVVAQYCSRTLAGIPYLQIGSGLSNLTGPSLFFLKSGYLPMYYVDKLWLSEGHVFFTVMALLGLPFCWSHRGFRYVFSILVSLWICHTNFIAALSPRYCYYFQPLLVLSGVAATVMLYDRLVALARRESDSAIAAICAHTSGIAALLLVFLASNEFLFKEYELSSTGDTPGMMTRMNTYRYDYRSVDQYVKAHLQPGDVVFPGIPHLYAYYTGSPGDYFLDTLLGSKVPYNQLLDEPRFVDKFGGLPVVRNLTELKEAVNRGRRTWLIFAPYASFEKLSNPKVLEYLHANSRIVYETYRAKVLLIEGQSQMFEQRGSRTASAQTAE